MKRSLSTKQIFSTTILAVTVCFAAQEVQVPPATELWYETPATDWQTEALPIGNGPLGAMIFGGTRHERIALNEESVWSGSRTNGNRKDASQNLPKIRELLLAGKNAEAEALVNQTFTCTGSGSKGGAGGPWGCYQKLGNLNLVWASDVDPFVLKEWKYQIIDALGITDIHKQRSEATRLMTQSVKTVTDENGWNDDLLAKGKAVRGGRKLSNTERVVLRHHFNLSDDRHASLGVLRIDNSARQGQVYVNGQAVGELPGWQASGHEKFQHDVSGFLKPGDISVLVNGDKKTVLTGKKVE